MPTDTAHRSVDLDAPREAVLETIRAVELQPDWVPEIRTAEVLERQDDGRPALARFTAATAVGTDEYVLRYRHRADGMRWTLVSGRLQSAQQGDYTVRALGTSRCRVAFRLTISHPLPLPGFVRRRVMDGLVAGTLRGLAEQVARAPAG
jgi:hypothetical protein